MARKNERFIIGSMATVVCTLLIAMSVGCESKARTGAMAGAGLGAVAGQVAGGDTESTLIGTGVGTGVGYIIGNELDKEEADSLADGNPRKYHHDQVGDLGGTEWRILRMSPSSSMDGVASKTIEFTPNGELITRTTYADGDTAVERERYRVVGSTLIINQPGYLVNADYQLRGGRLTIEADDFRTVAERIE